MNFIEIKNKEKLNDFIGKQVGSQFLQSWQWGEFQEKAGNKILRVGVEDEKELIAAATLIKKPLFFGQNYFYCPRGPIFGIKNYELRITNYLFDEIKKLAKKDNVIFLRFEPELPISNLAYRQAGYKFKIFRTLDIQPSKTLVLDLHKSEGELLSAMHQKTRYNIRLAEKKGLKIFEAGISRFDDFWRLMTVTRDRDSYRLHNRSYYEKMLASENLVKLYFAEYENKPIAAVLISYFGDTVTYLHGASADENRNVMAPYLLQWHIIKDARNQRYKFYDFYGINETKWPGVTRFKKGFGGDELNYPGTFDLVFSNKWYNAYKVLRVIRRLIK